LPFLPLWNASSVPLGHLPACDRNNTFLWFPEHASIYNIWVHLTLCSSLAEHSKIKRALPLLSHKKAVKSHLKLKYPERKQSWYTMKQDLKGTGRALSASKKRMTHILHHQIWKP
jgi:hypothetical protein